MFQRLKWIPSELRWFVYDLARALNPACQHRISSNSQTTADATAFNQHVRWTTWIQVFAGINLPFMRTHSGVLLDEIVEHLSNQCRGITFLNPPQQRLCGRFTAGEFITSVGILWLRRRRVKPKQSWGESENVATCERAAG